MAACPSAASANAAAPLMLTSFLHLFFGNTLIGTIEAVVFAALIKSSAWRALFPIVVANYASAWIGGLLIVKGLASTLPITVENLGFWFAFLVVAGFVITLAIEYPFFWLAAPASGRPWRRLLPAVVVVHAVSYAALALVYFLVSGTSLLTSAKVVALGQFDLPAHHELYYISTSGHQVLRAPLNNPSTPVVVANVDATRADDRLFARPRADQGFDLFIYLEPIQDHVYREALVLERFAAVGSVDWKMAEGDVREADGTWFSFGPVSKIGGVSDWEFDAGFWGVEGLSGGNTKTGERVHLALETPLLTWQIRNAVQIPGDYVVAQVGADQICVFHLPSRRVALLARGKGPTVAVSSVHDTRHDPAGEPPAETASGHGGP